jgi:pimeloyl-ACP methyl ester carboxylesterase
MAAPAIERSYVQLGGRQVQLRRAGSGPAVVLLHQSPRSSAELEPLICALAEAGYAVIAPDTPGNGLSDPLPLAQPSVNDLAHALAGLFDALGLKRVPVYGYHTGASIACALAALYPRRVSLAVLNGLAAFSEGEQDDMLRRYFPPFAPCWDGSHLAWLWARMREQMMFFPWYAASAATRMPFPVAGADGLTLAALDFLRAGDAYRAPYRAAVAADGRGLLAQVQVPCLLMSTETDPLRPHRDRLAPHAGALTRVESLSGEPGRLAQRLCELLAAAVPRDMATAQAPAPRALAAPAAPQAPAGVAAPQPSAALPTTASTLSAAPAAAAAPARGVQRAFMQVSGRSLHLQRVAASGPASVSGAATTAPPLPLLLLHGLGEDAGVWRPLLAGADGSREIVAPDLPGFGESAAADDAFAIETLADTVATLMDTLGHPRFDVLGIGLGAVVAAALLQRQPGRVAQAIVAAPEAAAPAHFAAEQALLQQVVARDWAGSHLLRAWTMCRDRHLFHPWHLATRETSITDAPGLREDAVHAQAVAVLKCGAALPRAHAAAQQWVHARPWAGFAPRLRLARLAWETDTLGPAAAPALAALPRALTLPAEIASWSAALAPCLSPVPAEVSAFVSASVTASVTASVFAQVSAQVPAHVPAPESAAKSAPMPAPVSSKGPSTEPPLPGGSR